MIAFQDFLPQPAASGGTGLPVAVNAFDTAVIAANDWIKQHNVYVVSIETLLLPNVWNSQARGSLESRLHTSVDIGTNWFQVVRVWFDPEASGTAPRQAV